MKNQFITILVTVIILLTAVTSFTQTKANAKPSKTTSKVLKSDDAATDPSSTKPNERPATSVEPLQTSSGKTNNRADNPTVTNTPTNIPENPDATKFSYEFVQPNFLISNIFIVHDETGKGSLTFQQKDSDVQMTDPLQISPVALERIQKLWNELNFLDSTEIYQSERQYPHLGTMRLKMQKGLRQRNSEFNWTNNKTAESLVNEYRKLGDQFIWIFDVNVARENQPLETPNLVARLDYMIQRDGVSDALQMKPFLQELRDDERLPLIARNNLTKILQKIEKSKAAK